MNRSAAAPSVPVAIAALAVLAATATGAAVPAGPPRVSPMSTVSQVVGVSEIEIAYSRPAVRERTIWGELVPWGEVWRTGANEATTIRFSDDVKIDGQPLAAGTYGLFTIPDEDEWTVIFNRQADQWGAFQYDAEKDALRIRVRPRSAEHQERFEISIPEVGADTAVVELRWASVSVPFTAQFAVEEIAVRKARGFVAAAAPADGRMVWNWTNYCYQNGLNLDEALGWAASLAQAAPIYWTHALHARLLARTGRPQEAVAAAERALERAAEEKDQPGVESDARSLTAEASEWRAAGTG